MATISEVAKRAGVAPSVVSRLLNQDPYLRIRPQTRTRVMAAVEELGYVPSSSARSLRRARTGTLGLIVPDVTNPVYAEVLRGAEQKGAQAGGYVLLLGNIDDLASDRERYRQLTGSGRVDGLLLQRANTMDDDVLCSFLDTSVPTVLVNSRLEDHVGSVTLDDTYGATVAIDHLFNLGHTNIAHLGGPEYLDTAQRRRTGYERAMSRRGLPHDGNRTVMTGYDYEACRAGIAKLLDQRPRPTAVFAATLSSALTVLTYLRERGVRVPDEISVIALHDNWFTTHSCPPLTTVKMPLYELGKEAAGLIINLVEGGVAKDVVVREPAPTLRVRASTAPPPVVY